MATIKRRPRPAVEQKPTSNGPLAAWGPPAFADSADDEVDGTRIGGLLLRRAPDGTLVAIVEPKERADG
jgi:hypothetical protein